ncbi:unnamed protein product (macronuclear) [Paramecium tetraurelia]|uniref:EF-hand domain-containing protein n=1 Tax=Paramecium tetraurelia TaxID=5888 RepID=A0BJD8_PARTE|nr:uncharacterized protein GSPATT00005028001 [Paramecium tetraurelia]CAK58655.1 unnamed protein product [Paramecium tetraurelia]|eukprot:XP_001426053.1 hypothetical protein (macronuclear) [Paramecium tetraurelia strain d4-2]
MEEQENRQHKKNEKLEKRRKKEKEIKKNKKKQKKEQLLLRGEKRSKFFAQKDKKDKNFIDRQKVLKTFKLFLKIYQDDLEDFFQLFKQLDDGNVIETADIENPNIRTTLQKFMKQLQLKNRGTEQTPIFKKLSDIKLEPYVRGLYDQVIQEVNQQKLQSDLSDQESSRSQSPQKETNKEKHENLKQQVNEKDQNLKKQQLKVKELKEEVYQDKKYNRIQVRNSMYADFEIKPKKQLENNEQQLDSFLEDQFSKVEQKKQPIKDENIRKKIKIESNTLVNQSNQIQTNTNEKKQNNFICKKDFNRQTNLTQENQTKNSLFMVQIQNQFI